MKIKSILYFLSCFSVAWFNWVNAAEKVDLSYYLSNSAKYHPSISEPATILGYQVGEWHARPEQIFQYYQLLAKQSDRIKLEIIGYTHEKRPLFLVYISSPQNINRLEAIRKAHLSVKQTQTAPAITWLAYSVHGNEASGSNASLLLAYHLAAANDAKTQAQLEKQVIIIDPMLNPDGLARFAHWVNMYQSRSSNADPADIEHHEIWPKGRTNHYWFDLNRDWLLLQHPESQARVKQFHRWRPHVLGDFHEMGTNSSYFFQPGVHSRQNPLTPKDNFNMTAIIAEYHAKALDNIGSLYYSKENFDDFYYGKGSTYPDVHGSVGILFEQASARGHVQKSNNGNVTFPFAVRNHLTTSLSTIEAVQNNLKKLKQMPIDFAEQTKKMAQKDKQKAVVFASGDEYRLRELQRILSSHQIQFYSLTKELEVEKQLFKPDEAFIIPLQQPQYRLIKSMFESRKNFSDNVFYDVSAWNFGMAFDLNFAFVSRSDFSRTLLGQTPFSLSTNEPQQTLKQLDNPEVIALAFDWKHFNVAQLLSKMQQWGLRVQVVTKPAKFQHNDTSNQLSLGSLIVPLNSQKFSRQQILNWLKPKLNKLKIKPITIASGLAVSGVDMGSPSVPPLKSIKPLLIIGDGVSSYDAGEVWHLLDQRLSQPVTMITQSQLESLTIQNYTHLILVNGSYQLSETLTQKIKSWVNSGGVIIAHSTGAQWALSQAWSSSEVKEFKKAEKTKISYANKSHTDAKHYVGGAIVWADIDVTHPLGFGLDDTLIAIFKRGQLVFTEPEEAFVSIARFTNKPHAAGYLSAKVEKHIADSSSIIIQGIGKGKLVAFSDNPLFRGFWLGTSRIFTNALYFSNVIQAPQKTKKDEAKKR